MNLPLSDEEIRNRFNILTWAIGAVGGLTIALLGTVISMSYQLGQISGELTILINHITLK